MEEMWILVTYTIADQVETLTATLVHASGAKLNGRVNEIW